MSLIGAQGDTSVATAGRHRRRTQSVSERIRRDVSSRQRALGRERGRRGGVSLQRVIRAAPVLLGVLLWNEWPDRWLLLGALIVIGAGIYMSRVPAAR